MDRTKEEEPLFNIDLVRKNAGGNDKLISEFLKLFIASSESILEETKAAINKGNFPEVARQMHKIGPGLNYLNIHHLSKRVKDLEQVAKNGGTAPLINKIFEEIEPVLRSCIEQLRAMA